MEEIGRILRETREQLGLTLEEAERNLKIRASRLAALENGEFDTLPSQAQARGFLNNYAEFLGLEPIELLRQYDESRLPPRRRSLTARVPSKTSANNHSGYQVRTPGWFSSEILIVASIAIAVIVVLVWGGMKIYNNLGSGEDAIVAGNPAEEITLPVATDTPSPTANVFSEPPPLITDEPTATSTLILNVLDAVNLQVISERDAWVQVLVDGEESFKGRTHAGEQHEFLGEERVEVSTGNGGGIRVIFNGQDQGLMGDIGQVITRIWTPRGAQTPTPTQTLTPTASPETTETATPTAVVPEG